MSKNPQLAGIDIAKLVLVKYPDPRLLKPTADVEVIDDDLAALAERMFAIMFEAHGVGLAAPQAGVSLRMFVASPTFDPNDLHVYINPRIIATEGTYEDEEGCLSLPGIRIKLKRAATVTLRAIDLTGQEIEETGTELLARIFQHETDHLDGRLLVHRMGSVAKLANRRQLRELEEKFADGK